MQQPLWCLFLALSLFLHDAVAQQPSEYQEGKGNDYVKVSLVSDREVFQPPKTTTDPVGLLGIKFEIEPGWHIYWENSGDSGLPTEVKWNLPDTWEAGELNWPAPVKFRESGDLVTFGYEQEVLLFTQVLASLPDEGNIKISADVKWLVCKNLCVPGKTRVFKEIRISESESLRASDDFQLFKNAHAKAPDPVVPGRVKIEFDKSFYFPGDKAQILFSFPELENAKEIRDSVQIFPVSSKDVSALEGFPVEGSTSLVLPASILSSAKPGVSYLKGTILVNPLLAKKLGLPNYFSWSAPVQIKNEKGTPQLVNAMFPSSERIASKSLSSHTVTKAEEASDVAMVETPTVKREAPSGKSILYYLSFAYLGGLLLNLMPCVLPVLSIKAFSLVENAGKPRSERLRGALSYVGGVLAAFLVLALVVVIVRRMGVHVGWGFQFQSPVFLLFLILAVFSFAFSFFGFFSISLPGLKQSSASSGKFTDFLDGVLTTALSTPCTAPFLGTALAFAFLAPDWSIVLIFLTIGFGLATPFLILSQSSSMLKYLPTPGAWMTYFRQLMGFFLLATVVWLLNIYSQVSAEGFGRLLWILLLLGFCFWVYKLEVRNTFKQKLLKFGLLLYVVFALVFSWDILVSVASEKGTVQGSSEIDWQSFSKDQLAKAKKDKRAVFIDFTADWCVTCKANEKLVIETQRVSQALNTYNVLPLIADWTRGDESVSAALREYGGSGVPHYVILYPNGEVSEVLSSLLTKEALITAFKKAASGR